MKPQCGTMDATMSFRPALARVAVLLAALVWVMAFGTRLSHEANAKHAVCEHGELVEATAIEAPADRSVIRAHRDLEHEHCAYDLYDNEIAVFSPTSVPEKASFPPVRLLGLHSPLPTPPLRYAPKTGPPTT